MSDEQPEATPAAEERAEELGVPLDEVDGSGAEGRILVSDVEQAAGDPHEEWLARVKASEEAEAEAQRKREEQAAYEAEVHEKELAAQQGGAEDDETAE